MTHITVFAAVKWHNMKTAIVSIQRNRGRWLTEWLSFHHTVGFDKFFLYLHKCTDDSAQIASKLSNFFDISIFEVPSDAYAPQLLAYKHCYENFGNEYDWLAFVDGDEFIFSTYSLNIKNSLAAYQGLNLDAIGVYWACFGSSGHISEPEGLLTDNYRFRPEFDFSANSHIKSIVRGGLGNEFKVSYNSHYFDTPRGTYDSNLRPITGGLSNNYPVYNHFRINHYVVQSREYYLNSKKYSGAADAGQNVVREESWWLMHDRNEVYDNSLLFVREELLKTIRASQLLVPKIITP